MRFIPNLLGDSTNLQEGLTTESAKPSRRFYKSPRRIDNWVLRISENDWQLILQFSDNGLQQHKRVSIYWRTKDSVVNSSQRFYESLRRFGIKRTKTRTVSSWSGRVPGQQAALRPAMTSFRLPACVTWERGGGLARLFGRGRREAATDCVARI
jgi:hypothetical protein